MSNVDQVVIFRSNDNEFALDIMKVQEIIRLKKITDVPQANKYIIGVVNLRGAVLPVLDFKLMIRNISSDFNTTKRIIIVELDGYKIGVLVDSVREVLRLEGDCFEELNGTGKGKDLSSTMIKLNKGERIISLIDLDLFQKCIDGQAFDEVTKTESSLEFKGVV